jgi:ribosomal protein L35
MNNKNLNKMKKSVISRIKIKSNKKILRRKMGVCHFRTKKSKKSILLKKKASSLDLPIKKILNYQSR